MTKDIDQGDSRTEGFLFSFILGQFNVNSKVIALVQELIFFEKDCSDANPVQ